MSVIDTTAIAATPPFSDCPCGIRQILNDILTSSDEHPALQDESECGAAFATSVQHQRGLCLCQLLERIASHLTSFRISTHERSRGVLRVPR